MQYAQVKRLAKSFLNKIEEIRVGTNDCPERLSEN